MKRNTLEGSVFPPEFEQSRDLKGLSIGPRSKGGASRKLHAGIKDRRYVNYQDPYEKNPYGMDIMKASAWANIIFMSVIVISVLVLLLVYTGSKKSVNKVEDSVIILSRSAERALNATRDVTSAIGDINLTQVLKRSISHDENDWVNATQNVKRSLGSISRLVTEADATRSVKKYSDLAQTITNVLTSKKVSSAMQKYSDTAIWAMDWLQSSEAQSTISTMRVSLQKIANTVQSEETHEIVNEFVNGRETKELVNSTRHFVDHFSNSIKLMNEVIDEINREETIKHMTEIVKDIKKKEVLEKLERLR